MIQKTRNKNKKPKNIYIIRKSKENIGNRMVLITNNHSEEYYLTHPVTVSLADLKTGICDDLLPYAFGPSSLGIIIVKDLPKEFLDLRFKVLSSASTLARLPGDILKELEVPQSHWLIGWSKGKEKLSGGLPDDTKGSYYINCSFYKDDKLEGPPENEIKGYEQYKAYTTPSVWPPEDQMPLFKENIKSLCSLMIDTAVEVARACDRLFGEKIEGYDKHHLEKIVSTSTTTKARLLHYFPPQLSSSSNSNLGSNSRIDSWCGEHLDHSCLTALTSAMFLDDTDYPRMKELASDPDPQSGLYIKNRKGEIVQIQIPKDCLAFQTGSALEETTRGSFKAVPHFVRGSYTESICRNTLAIFCQPSLHESVGPNFKDFAAYASYILEKNH